MPDLLVLLRPAKSCRMAQASVEKLEHTGPAEKKRVVSVPQREQLAGTLEPSLPKGKGIEHQIIRRAFSVREVKKTASKERKRDEYFSAEEQ